MAKVGNKSTGKQLDMRGPCKDCGSTQGPFTAVRRADLRKVKMVKLCEECVTRV
jgi:hypothetical protein